MEYCSGGDLYTRINTGTLTNKDEINCYFKQVFYLFNIYTLNIYIIKINYIYFL